MDGDFQTAGRHITATARTTAHAMVDTHPAYDVRALMGDGQVALMVLDGQTYFLRVTRSGKLILTK